MLTTALPSAEATKDKKYIDASKAAYDFIMRHMMQADPNIPIDTLKVDDCAKHNWIFTYNTAKFVEGAVVLSRVSGDGSYRDQALKTVVDAVKKGKWNDDQGNILEGQGGDPATGGTTRQFKSACAGASGDLWTAAEDMRMRRHLPPRSD